MLYATPLRARQWVIWFVTHIVCARLSWISVPNHSVKVMIGFDIKNPSYITTFPYPQLFGTSYWLVVSYQLRNLHVSLYVGSGRAELRVSNGATEIEGSSRFWGLHGLKFFVAIAAESRASLVCPWYTLGAHAFRCVDKRAESSEWNRNRHLSSRIGCAERVVSVLSYLLRPKHDRSPQM